MFSQIYNIFLNFDSNPLICDPTLFPGKNSLNIAKNSRSFPGKMRWDRALVLTYFDSPVAEAFPRYYLSFLDFGHLQGEWVVKVGPELFKQCFYFLFGNIGPYFGEQAPKNLAKRAILWMLNRYAKLWKLLTQQPQMLFWWNLPRLCIFIRV